MTRRKSKRAGAKFRVGQVVAFRGGGGVGKITRCAWLASPTYCDSWCYWLGGGGYTPEEYLRPLTKRERGGQ